jgi:hypothetical protein
MGVRMKKKEISLGVSTQCIKHEKLNATSELKGEK